jgi:hypothetical protein
MEDDDLIEAKVTVTGPAYSLISIPSNNDDDSDEDSSEEDDDMEFEEKDDSDRKIVVGIRLPNEIKVKTYNAVRTSYLKKHVDLEEAASGGVVHSITMKHDRKLLLQVRSPKDYSLQDGDVIDVSITKTKKKEPQVVKKSSAPETVTIIDIENENESITSSSFSSKASSKDGTAVNIKAKRVEAGDEAESSTSSCTFKLKSFMLMAKVGKGLKKKFDLKKSDVIEMRKKKANDDEGGEEQIIDEGRTLEETFGREELGTGSVVVLWTVKKIKEIEY